MVSILCTDHPGMHVAQECLANVSPEQFWSIADNYPDLVKCLHVQIRLAGNFGLNGGVPWLLNTEGALCFMQRKRRKCKSFSFRMPRISQ